MHQGGTLAQGGTVCRARYFASVMSGALRLMGRAAR